MKRFFRSLSLLFLLTILFYLLFGEEWGKSVLDILFFLLIIDTLPRASQFLIEKDINNDLKNIKGYRKRRYSMYLWLDQEFNSDYVVYDIVGDKIEYYDTLTNLRLLKELVKDKIGDDINDYRLLKEMLEIHIEENFLRSLASSSKSFMLAIIPSMITAVFTTKEISRFFMLDDRNIHDIISVITSIGLIMALLLFAFSLFHNLFTKSKNRALMLIKVIDLIIKEDDRVKSNKH